MQYFYPLLVYTGLAGIVLLLVLEIIPGLHSWRKPMAAAWLTLLTFTWLILPQNGQWVFSIWLPSSVLGGQLLVAMTPGVWTLGLVLGLVLTGLSWVDAVESSPTTPLSGVLVLVILMLTWLALAGGSLLTTLAAWAVFDIFWGVARLLSGGLGERATFGLALHGFSSVILWTVSLLLERSGASALWWLMWPTPAIMSLLVLAALLRLGVYPFQIILPRRIRQFTPLTLVSSLGPVLGSGLLYRIMALPGTLQFPSWATALGALSFLFLGLRAWSYQESHALYWASYALLGSILVGASVADTPHLVLMALAVWIAAWALLSLSRSRDKHLFVWSVPGWLALLCLLGVPPSPLGALYRTSLVLIPWPWRLFMIAGWGMTSAVFLREMLDKPPLGSILPAWPWQQVGLAVGLGLPVVGLLLGLLQGFPLSISWLGMLLWTLAILVAVLLIWRGMKTSVWLRRGKPILDFFDLAWLYRSLWQGLEHLLSLVRTVAEVVEGRGALLWSLLVLLVVLLVVMNR